MKTTIIKERLQSALIGILFIAVFLPFGLNHFGWMRWVLLGGLGVIIAFCVLVSEYVVEKVFRTCIGEACIKSAISSGNSKRHNCSTVCCRRDSARKHGSNRNSNLKSLPTTTT